MAGKVATIISLGLDKPWGERPIANALRGRKSVDNLEVRVQPIDGTYGYLVVGHKKQKALAEAGMMDILKAYKSLGGKEFNEDVLSSDSPVPSMAGFTNDMARVPPTMAQMNGLTEEEHNARVRERLFANN
jgi:hypothetical protein